MVLWQATSRLFRHVLNEGLLYLVCRDDGQILAGATVEDVGYAAINTCEGLEPLREFAIYKRCPYRMASEQLS